MPQTIIWMPVAEAIQMTAHLPIQHGLATYLIHRNSYDFLETNQFGLITKKRNLKWKPRKKTEEEIEDNITVPDKTIRFEDIIISILALLDIAVHK